MANRFLGLPVLVTFGNGTSIDGTVSNIDVVSGTLTLQDARIHRDGAGSEPIAQINVQRNEVKDIQVLALKPTAKTPQIQPTSSGGSIEQSLRSSQSAFLGPQTGQKLFDRSPTPDHLAAFDPAILSIGRTPPAPRSNASSQNTKSTYEPTFQEPSPKSARPAPSSLASNSTIAALSTASGPRQQPPSNQTQQGSARAGPRQQLKKKQLKDFGRRFGGAETAGSEADESHVANSEAPVIRKKATNTSLRPHQRYPTGLQANDTEAELSDVHSNGSLNEDFDFSRGLASFNKALVFEEIREADRTDPNSRLVAHNRRQAQADKYATKLKFNENVLDASETDDAPEMHRFQGYYPNMADSSVLPHETMTEGLTTEDEDALSDNGRPPPLVRQAGSGTAVGSSGRTGPASAMLATSTNVPMNTALPRRQMRTSENTKVVSVTEKIWKEINQLCNIESGPSSLQRIENGARGIASIAFREVEKARRLSQRSSIAEVPANIVILTTACNKGSYGLRAGAHLVNHGANCTAYLSASDQLPAAFESQLRLFSSTGGKVVRSAEDLPDNADIILDALTDNETGTKRNRADSAIAEAVSWALGCTPLNFSTASPIVSLDLPSNTDPDTGSPSAGAIWSITPSAVIALGVVKQPSVSARYALHLVDIGLPLTAIERAGVKDYKRPFLGDVWATSVL